MLIKFILYKPGRENLKKPDEHLVRCKLGSSLGIDNNQSGYREDKKVKNFANSRLEV